jgi:hypothetical protein
MKSFLNFVVVGYEEKREDGSLIDVVTFELIAKDSDEAIKKAKKIYKKSFYRISQVFEKEIIR